MVMAGRSLVDHIGDRGVRRDNGCGPKVGGINLELNHVAISIAVEIAWLGL